MFRSWKINLRHQKEQKTRKFWGDFWHILIEAAGDFLKIFLDKQHQAMLIFQINLFDTFTYCGSGRPFAKNNQNSFFTLQSVNVVPERPVGSYW
jgi:hypothetical protein